MEREPGCGDECQTRRSWQSGISSKDMSVSSPSNDACGPDGPRFRRFSEGRKQFSTICLPRLLHPANVRRN